MIFIADQHHDFKPFISPPVNDCIITTHENYSPAFTAPALF